MIKLGHVDTQSGEVRIIRSGYQFPRVMHSWHVIVTSKRQHMLNWAPDASTVTLLSLMAPGRGSVMHGAPAAWLERFGFTVDAETMSLPERERTEAVERLAYDFIGTELIPDAPRLACEHLPSPSGSGPGYTTVPDNGAEVRICYACASMLERDYMRHATKVRAYMSDDGKSVVDMYGSELGTVREHSESHDGTRRHVRVRDTEGVMWHGSGPVRTGTYVTLHRTKIQPSHNRPLPDARFSVAPEFCGNFDIPGPDLRQGQRWVVRFCDSCIGVSAMTRGEAIDKAHAWNEKRMA